MCRQGSGSRLISLMLEKVPNGKRREEIYQRVAIPIVIPRHECGIPIMSTKLTVMGYLHMTRKCGAPRNLNFLVYPKVENLELIAKELLDDSNRRSTRKVLLRCQFPRNSGFYWRKWTNSEKQLVTLLAQQEQTIKSLV